ncbi:Hypothetical predicted protein [Olea europaea subsp. europaea]|uniref:Uncharacterized protein n=1 Tax=Olea europaea subsp. europaea TaxID=158383 RepID=A0A8S0PYW9_OLEEU|nr:Hypothetical predicted protein [Olea europaea subsp. europaea]
MVEAQNCDVIQTLLHIDDAPPDPKSFDRRLFRGNDGDTDNESDEDNNSDLVYKISEHGLEDSDLEEFVPPLSLQHSLEANRLVHPLSPTSQSPNTSLHQHHKIVTRSTIKNIPTCSGPLIETTHAPTHPEITARTLPNPGAEYGPSNDKLDQPPSHPTSVVHRHPGRKQGSGTAKSENVHRAEENNEALDDEIDDSEGIDIGHLLRTLDDHPTRGACKQIKISRIVHTTREKIRVLYNSTISSSEKKDLMDEITNGSKFPKVDTFEFTYAGKNKCWTCNAAKAQREEMLVKEHEYLIKNAKEQQLPKDIHVEEIPIDDHDAGINIMMSVLGMKPGRRILGLGDGRL